MDRRASLVAAPPTSSGVGHADGEEGRCRVAGKQGLRRRWRESEGRGGGIGIGGGVAGDIGCGREDNEEGK